MKMNQWTLVARVTDYDVDDVVRREVLQRAMERRQGSVVWQCIVNMRDRPTVEEREELFLQSFNCEVWQAVKPLVEERAGAGITHRDTALLEAIEQHQGDVVDHCQPHRADINMRDADGERR